MSLAELQDAFVPLAGAEGRPASKSGRMVSGKQLRVLLAGHSSSDLRGAKHFLQGQGCEGIQQALPPVAALVHAILCNPFEYGRSRCTTDPVLAATVCLSHDQAQKALLEGNFDVAVVEVSSLLSLLASEQPFANTWKPLSACRVQVRSTKSTRRRAQEVDGLKLLALEDVRTPVAG